MFVSFWLSINPWQVWWHLGSRPLTPFSFSIFSPDVWWIFSVQMTCLTAQVNDPG